MKQTFNLQSSTGTTLTITIDDNAVELPATTVSTATPASAPTQASVRKDKKKTLSDTLAMIQAIRDEVAEEERIKIQKYGIK